MPVTLNKDLILEIQEALNRAGDFGSVELQVKNGLIVQITSREIMKVGERPKTPPKRD